MWDSTINDFLVGESFICAENRRRKNGGARPETLRNVDYRGLALAVGICRKIGRPWGFRMLVNLNGAVLSIAKLILVFRGGIAIA